MKNSKIEWTDATVNFLRGCTRMSEGCRFCYAERVGERWSKKGQPYEGLVLPSKVKGGHPRWSGEVRLIEKALAEPKKWKEPRMIFVNSMSDTFHEKVPFDYIERMFQVMRETPWHTYQVLTKRSHRLLKQNAFIDWPDNVWMGVSVEDDRVLDRIARLQRTGAKVKFLSLEPLIGPIDLRKNINTGLDPLAGIDWVIVGGESGNQARIMEPKWAEDLVEACDLAGVACFVKQMGTAWSRRQGSKNFKGDDFSAFPEKLRVREYPVIEVESDER